MTPVGYDPTASEGAVRMVVIAGPNGSGKSSTIDELRSRAGFPREYINADDISKTDPMLRIQNPSECNLRAAQKAEHQRQSSLSRPVPFALKRSSPLQKKSRLFRTRYYEAMRLPPHTLDHANRADVHDSSVHGGNLVCVAHKDVNGLELRSMP